MRRATCAQQLLGGGGLDLQVLRDRARRPGAQRDPSQPRHAVAVSQRRETSRAARSDVRGTQVARPRQGTHVPHDHRGLATRCLEAQELAAAPTQALSDAPVTRRRRSLGGAGGRRVSINSVHCRRSASFVVCCVLT